MGQGDPGDLSKILHLKIKSTLTRHDYEGFRWFWRIIIQQERFEFLPIDLGEWWGHGIDLTSVHRYKKSEIYKL